MNNAAACVVNGTGSTSALDPERGCVRPQSGTDAKQDTHLTPEKSGKIKCFGTGGGGRGGAERWVWGGLVGGLGGGVQ